MKSLTVKRTSVFPASLHEVFRRLQKLRTLQCVAWPYASFAPTDDSENIVWEEGSISSYRFRLFGLIPLGTHTIRVIRFGEENGIYTHEGNEYVPVWNHEIILEERPDGTCEYTDKVEIGAGWKTPVIYLWACCFYAHRQRKWIRLLKKHGKKHGRRTNDTKRSDQKRL